ncbi:MAG: hypothetical protein U1F43_10360 [Myxococcota bacterium]
MRRLGGVAALAIIAGVTGIARAEAPHDRFSAGGYLRIMTRPDLQGGDGRLGYWNLYGRLLNEGPYAALELKLELLPQTADAHAAWTSVHARIEGGSVQGADSRNGSLSQFRLSQLYARAGNVLLENVTWQIGTLDSWMGDLGLYDLRPAELFYETVGLSARYQAGAVDLLVGVGDSGYLLRGERYDSALTAGSWLRLSLGRHAQVGVGGQLVGEPQIRGNRFAPHATPGVGYEDYVRGEVVEAFAAQNPGELDQFPKPEPRSNLAWKAIFYLGFGAGPLRWNNLFAKVAKKPAEQFVTETFDVEGVPRDFVIHTHDLTDQRYSFQIGDEAQLTLVENRLDVVIGLLYGSDWDEDNDGVVPSDDDRWYGSAIVRLQAYATNELHFLLETSLAREKSENGNAYRRYADSIFTGQDGLSDPRGLEYGDSDTRDTWQLKVGPVLSPLGLGVFTRPSFRLLYGLQWSSQINAFGNSLVESLDQFNVYGAPNQRWHHLIALEVEAWF